MRFILLAVPFLSAMSAMSAAVDSSVNLVERQGPGAFIDCVRSIFLMMNINIPFMSIFSHTLLFFHVRQLTLERTI